MTDKMYKDQLAWEENCAIIKDAMSMLFSDFALNKITYERFQYEYWLLMNRLREFCDKYGYDYEEYFPTPKIKRKARYELNKLEMINKTKYSKDMSKVFETYIRYDGEIIYKRDGRMAQSDLLAWLEEYE